MTGFPIARALALTAVACALNGCFLLVVGGAGAEGGYLASQEKRTASETASDQWIHTKITSSFVAHSKVKKRNINIDVFKGTVTLQGTVGSSQEREAAVGLAKSVAGVNAVVDRLKVK